MNTSLDVQALQARIAQAQLVCMRWRALTCGEQYLEAYCQVEALELQLELSRRLLPPLEAPA